MRHNRRAGTTSPKDTGLPELEDILIQAAARGDFEILLDEELREMEEAPVSAEVISRIRAGVRQRSQIRQKLSAARRTLGPGMRALPDVVRAAREAAQLSLEDIAAALHTTVLNVRRVESADVDALSLAPEFIARILELFSITCEELAESVRYVVARNNKASTLGALAARAPKADVHEIERALHDVAGMLAEEGGDVTRTQIPEERLEEVRHVLRRWGREDLAT